MTNPSDGYTGNAGTRNPEEPASAAYLPPGYQENLHQEALLAEQDIELEPHPPGVPKADICALLAYNWVDEERDYFAHLADDGPNPIDDTHIYPAMVRIDRWLNG